MQYEVLSPWAEVDTVPSESPPPRVNDLNDKTIGLFAGFKEHWPLILEEVERQLKERFPTAEFSHFRYPKDCVELADDDEYRASLEEWLSNVDTAISGHGDAGSCALFLAYNTALIERRGKPVVMMVKRLFANVSRSGASARGVPSLRLVSTEIPDLSGMPSFEGVVENIIRPGIDSTVIDNLIAALTTPLTPEEKTTGTQVEKPARIAFKGSIEEVDRFFYKSGWTYGMPIMPPTEEAVSEMLTGTDLPPEHVVAEIPPKLGRATVEKIGVNAVMAGCLPTYMPVLIAAVQAMMDYPKLKPAVSIEAYTCSVASWAPLLIVNGQIRRDLHINSGQTLMSPYYRANAAIGHALGLITINIGGVRPGMEDMAAFGHEGRFGMCIAENEEESPWEPLHVNYGFSKQDSTVTLFYPNNRKMLQGGMSTAEMLRDICDNVESFGWDPGCAIILTPMASKAFAEEGWTQRQIISYIVEYARKPAASVNLRWARGNQHLPEEVLLPAEPTRSMRRFVSSKHILILTASSQAYGALIMLYGGGGDHGGPYTKKVDLPANWDKLVEKYKDFVPTYAPY